MESEADPHIPFLPLTTIREVEWAKVADNMAYKLDGGATIWGHYLAQTTSQLTTSQYEALKKAETELYGSQTARLAIDSGSVPQELQAQIDQSI